MKITADSAATFRALADETRFLIFQTLLESAEGLTVDDLSATVGVHRNTIRPHLLRLEEAGLVESKPEPKPTIGRPRRIYFAHDQEGISTGADEPLSTEDYRLLADILLSIINRESIPDDRRTELAREWGHYLVTSTGPLKPGTKLSRTAILESISTHLNGMGFKNYIVEQEGKQIVYLTNCPFATLAAEHPKLVCQIHKGVVEGMLEALGAGSHEVKLAPLAPDGTCSAILAL